MKTLFYTITASLALLLTGCGGAGAPTNTLPTLDLAAAIDNPRIFNLAEIAEKIEFTPLDDSDERGLVGEITSIEESKNDFFVLDRRNRSTPLKVFDKTGKFIAARGTIGRGPNEILGIWDMAVDYETGNLYLNSSSGSTIACDTNGRVFARSDSIPASVQIAYSSGRLVSGKRSFGFPADPSGKIPFLRIYSADLKPEATIEVSYKGPNDAFVDFGSGMASMFSIAYDVVSNNGEFLVVKEGRSDSVFYFTGDSRLHPAYRFDMGDLAIPDEAFDSGNLNAFEGKYAINNIIECGKYLFVSPDGPGEPTSRIIVFDREDSSGGFFATGPHGRKGLFIEGVAFTPFYARAGRLVGYMRALDIVDNAEVITDPQLKALAATLKEDSNPVIVVVTLKK